MPDFVYDPPVPTKVIQPFVQRVDLRERGKIIATARWHFTASNDGVAQVLDLTVLPDHQRRGNGSTLLNAVIAQAVAFGKTGGIPIRRIWIAVEQKTQVKARAFLTRNGFHHVATISELLAHQDSLVYMRSLD
ncbi:MAG: GNAT family N-acetyltransferase [Phycisphaerae bacterium]|nr:GNAT family N-acetyltransferase [Phycisphaerae bacterium]